MTNFFIPACSPFRFDLALRYLARSPDEILDIVRDGLHYRVIEEPSGPALIEAAEVWESDNVGLRVRVLSGAIDPEIAVQAIKTIFQTGGRRPLLEFQEPLGKRLTDAFAGLPVVQTLSAWEALVWAILGQQITIAFAYKLKRAFVEQFGGRLVYDGQVFFAFPSPERVAALDHERDLRPMQFSRQKSRYIIEAARAIASGDFDLAGIAALDDEDATEELQRLTGVGRWTAEYILLRGFGRLDVIPAGDAALKMAVGRQLELGRSASEDEVRLLAEHWRPRRGEIGFKIWFARQAGWFR